MRTHQTKTAVPPVKLTPSASPTQHVVEGKTIIFKHWNKWQSLCLKQLSDIPMSERDSYTHSDQPHCGFEEETNRKSLDNLFLETIKKIQPKIISENPNPKTLFQKTHEALKADPDLMNRFIEVLLSHGELEITNPNRNEILDLVFQHPDTELLITTRSLIVRLKEGYIFREDYCYPTITAIPESGQLIVRKLITCPKPFCFQGQNIVKETRFEDGQKIDRYWIPLPIEEAARIFVKSRQKVE